MLVMERAAAVEQTEPAVPSPTPKRRGPVLAMAAGLVLVSAAGALVYNRPAPAPASSAITLGGPADVTVQRTTYAPGQSSGWHTHTGIHAVMVLSGTVTFYDGQCQARSYGAGETYVGGQDVHVATNDTTEQAELSVTYLFPAGRAHTTFHVASPAPAGCDVR